MFIFLPILYRPKGLILRNCRMNYLCAQKGMQTIHDSNLKTHISFEYTSFDRVVLRGYAQRLFC